MPVFIHQLGTAVPEKVYQQEEVRELMKARAKSRREAHLVHRIYNQSGIATRHSAAGEDFFFAPDGDLKSPGTKARNDRYVEAAKKLFVQVAGETLAAAPGFSAGAITHVITVSCTGFFAPGPDYVIAKELCLPPSVQRFHLGFMGCFAAFPALRMAQAFCQADPEAVVLVVCLELCTLHLQDSSETDALVATSLFADGGAAALVSARPPQGPSLEMTRLSTELLPASEEEMSWTVGDFGCEMTLSSYVPRILEANVGRVLAPLLEGQEIEYWAIHPGGRAILDKVQHSLGLTDEQTAASRAVLRSCGNMSSATILFVLRELLAGAPGAGHLCALAFGPGLTVESGLFLVHPG
jgi:predicted naringenin-chalcone synthase